MSEFNYNLKTSKNSASKRKLVYGIGINDADYSIKSIINGRQILDPFYRKWQGMLERCYSDKFIKSRPTYIGCTVCDEWHSFMAFRAWMKTQDWKHKALDKDLLIQGNKVYSPDTCCFVTVALNNLLFDHSSARGRFPQGVTWHKRAKKYVSSISLYGKIKHIGCYGSVNAAEMAYKEAKASYLKEVAMKQIDIRLRDALLARSTEFLEVA